MDIGKLKQRESGFYERNIGSPVNLFGDKKTWSGNICDYNEGEKIVILTNYINRKYSEDGSSLFVEDSGKLELDTRFVGEREITTREDRLGRIVKYNQDLRIEEIQRRKILNQCSQDKETQSHSD